MGGPLMGGRGSKGRTQKAADVPGPDRKPAKDADQPKPQDPPAARPATDRIRETYDRLLAAGVTRFPGTNSAYVSLVEIRKQLGDLPREEVDQALRQLMRDDRVRLEPEQFGHAIGPEQQAAAILIGGEPRHNLHIDRS